MTTLAPPAAPALRPHLSGLTAESVFVRRSLIHSLRDGESLLMAILLLGSAAMLDQSRTSQDRPHDG